MAVVANSDFVSYMPRGDVDNALIAAVVGDIGGCGNRNELDALKSADLGDSGISSR